MSRFYGNPAPKGYREYQLVKCTDFNSFKSQLTDVKPNIKCVVISVIENFLADKVGKETESPDPLIIECLNEFVSTIESTVARLPDTRIGVVMPLGRPALQWYQDRLDDITSKLKAGIGSVISGKKGKNLTKIECVSSASQQFEYDRIHLTPAAGQVFIEFVLDQAEDFFESELVDFGDEDEEGEVNKEDLKQLESRLKRIEDQMND